MKYPCFQDFQNLSWIYSFDTHWWKIWVFEKLILLINMRNIVCIFVWRKEVLIFSLTRFFICISAFLLEHSRFAGQQGREAISLTPLYHFHPLHRHLDIIQVITVESSPLHIAAGLESGTYGFWAQVANH